MGLIVDDYCTKETGRFLKQQYSEFDTCLSKYVCILKDIKENGIKSGELSEALEEFISQVQGITSQTGETAKATGEKYGLFCDNYIEALDKADGVLY